MVKEFCIISNNCWGAEVYKEFGLEYNTPFVGLFIPPLDFVKLCNDLPYYLAQPLQFIKRSRFSDYQNINYPLAVLSDVEIHFVHYKSEEDAVSKWNRRRERMPQNTGRYYIKGDDRELSDWTVYTEAWNKIPYKKIFFSKANHSGVQNLVWLSEYSGKNAIPDGKALYKVSKNHISIENLLSDQPFWRPFIQKKFLTTVFMLTPRRFR
ncbi:MAG: DUF1919 domain-containing protein [Sphingobacteriales bacterium]|nr:MAG: DUF1919 domain-containing protein [Sphingobacteriales bacterium]